MTRGKPLRRSKPLRATRWGVSRSTRGTSYSRRPRDWGRMAFVRSLPCDGVRLFPGHVCVGAVQADHLRDHTGVGRREPDDTVTPKCMGLHAEWTDHRGPFAGWHPDERLGFAHGLIVLARLAWDSLTDAEREHWDEVGTPASRRAAPC